MIEYNVSLGHIPQHYTLAKQQVNTSP